MTNTSADQRATPLPPGTKAPDFELPWTPDQTRAPSKSRFVLFVRGPHHEPAPHGGVDPGRKVGSGGRHTRTLGAYRDFDGALP